MGIGPTEVIIILTLLAVMTALPALAPLWLLSGIMQSDPTPAAAGLILGGVVALILETVSRVTFKHRAGGETDASLGSS